MVPPYSGILNLEGSGDDGSNSEPRTMDECVVEGARNFAVVCPLLSDIKSLQLVRLKSREVAGLVAKVSNLGQRASELKRHLCVDWWDFFSYYGSLIVR